MIFLFERILRDDIELIQEMFRQNELENFRNLLFGKIVNAGPLNGIKEKLTDIIIHPVCIISITDAVRTDVHDATLDEIVRSC